MKAFTITALSLVAATGAVLAYAGDGVSALVGDVAAASAPATGYVLTATPTEALAPGVTLYSDTGERIGAVRALTLRGDAVQSVWVGRTQYSAADIALVDGVAILNSDTSLAATGQITAAN